MVLYRHVAMKPSQRDSGLARLVAMKPAQTDSGLARWTSSDQKVVVGSYCGRLWVVWLCFLSKPSFRKNREKSRAIGYNTIHYSS